MATTKPKYACTTQELYSVCETGWENCSDNLADFTAFKKFYDAAYITAKEGAIAAAKLLPDEETRVGEHEVERVQLVPLLDDCLDNFQRLSAYIQDAFPKSEWKARKESAGGNYYKRASEENWEDTVAMNNAMHAFITTNLAALTAGDNMPATFQGDVSADGAAFLLKYNSFKAKRQTKPATEDKTAANNAIYDDLQKMFKDGTTIYRKNAGKKSLFVFSTIKDMVSPPGSASLKVSVITLPDNAAAPNAAISMQADGGYY